jgi:hypothetical protein
MSDLGADHGPIQPELHDQMNLIAQALDDLFNGPGGAAKAARPIGFFLTSFYMNEPSRFNYISNADKLDVRAMLKEITARIEARLSSEGHA